MKMDFQNILLLALWIMISPFPSSAQNTVGVLSYDADLSIGGYNLLYPERQPNIYLLNECGEIVHTWEDENEMARPGAVAYLLENGNLIRAKSESGAFSSGGGGGIVELVNWEGEVQWRLEVNPLGVQQHHDIHVMPNGNILMLIWENVDYPELMDMGFDTIQNSQDNLIFESIWEINPSTDSIVWQWQTKDHLIQDFDANKNNFGSVADHPELIDINYQEFAFEKPDFMHANSLDYNAELDQILVSVRNYNEIWIIDHSTTTAEAATHSGGLSDKGGDLLYRWGNPKAYQNGTNDDQQLTRQHDVQWIDDFVNDDYEYFGDIVLFNNGLPNDNSLGQILRPTWDSISHSYLMVDSTYLPLNFSQTFSHPDTSKNHSTSASSIQILENGQVVMCAARQGFAFELTEQGEVAWEYRVPLRNGFPVVQGTTLALSENFTFQMQRYPVDYSVFAGKDLSPKGYLELDPNTGFCTLVGNEEVEMESNGLNIFPNPTSDILHIQNEGNEIIDFEIHNMLGQKIDNARHIKHTEIDVSNWQKGIYFITNKEINFTQKIIIQ